MWAEPSSASYPKGLSVRRQIGSEGCLTPKVNEIRGSVPSIAGNKRLPRYVAGVHKRRSDVPKC